MNLIINTSHVSDVIPCTLPFSEMPIVYVLNFIHPSPLCGHPHRHCGMFDKLSDIMFQNTNNFLPFLGETNFKNGTDLLSFACCSHPKSYNEKLTSGNG